MTAQRDDISIAQILNNVNQYVVTIATHLDCYAQNRDSTALSESLLILEQTKLQLNQINAAQGLTLLKEAKQLIELLQQRVSSPTQELLTYILQCLISLIPHAIQPEDSLAEDISNVLNDVRCLYATTPMVSSDVPRSMTIDQQGVGQDFIAVVSKLHHHYQQSLTGILKLKSPLHQYERLSRLFAKLQNICWKTPISPLWDTALGVCEALRAQQIQMSHQLLTILRSIDYQLRQLGTVGSNQINIAPEPQLLAQMRALVRHINSDNPLIIAMQQAQEPSHTLYVTVTMTVLNRLISHFTQVQKRLYLLSPTVDTATINSEAFKLLIQRTEEIQSTYLAQLAGQQTGLTVNHPQQDSSVNSQTIIVDNTEVVIEKSQHEILDVFPFSNQHDANMIVISRLSSLIIATDSQALFKQLSLKQQDYLASLLRQQKQDLDNRQTLVNYHHGLIKLYELASDANAHVLAALIYSLAQLCDTLIEYDQPLSVYLVEFFENANAALLDIIADHLEQCEALTPEALFYMETADMLRESVQQPPLKQPIAELLDYDMDWLLTAPVTLRQWLDVIAINDIQSAKQNLKQLVQYSETAQFEEITQLGNILLDVLHYLEVHHPCLPSLLWMPLNHAFDALALLLQSSIEQQSLTDQHSTLATLQNAFEQLLAAHQQDYLSKNRELDPIVTEVYDLETFERRQFVKASLMLLNQISYLMTQWLTQAQNDAVISEIQQLLALFIDKATTAEQLQIASLAKALEGIYQMVANQQCSVEAMPLALIQKTHKNLEHGLQQLLTHNTTTDVQALIDKLQQWQTDNTASCFVEA